MMVSRAAASALTKKDAETRHRRADRIRRMTTASLVSAVPLTTEPRAAYLALPQRRNRCADTGIIGLSSACGSCEDRPRRRPAGVRRP